MRVAPRLVYEAAVHVAAVAFIGWLASQWAPVRVAWGDALFWVATGLAAHAAQFDAVAVPGHRMRVSVGLAISTACLTLFPPPVAALVISINSLSWRDLSGKTATHKLLFNRSMFALCGGTGATVFQLLIRQAPDSIPWFIVSTLAAAFCHSSLNITLVTAHVALLSGQSMGQVWRSASLTLLHASYVTLAAFGAGLSLTYNQVGPVAVSLMGIPLIASYYGLRNSARIREFYLQVVQSLADSLDLREHETAGHTHRIAVFAQRLGGAIGLSGRELDSLYLAGLLHDLGKLGMPDHILLKPDALTEDEWREARRHPVDGARLLGPYEHLRDVAAIVRHHHERFDGTGYPDGLRGEEIPMGARIVSIVDAFDAMYMGRPYRAARSWQDVQEEMRCSAGSHFDPRVVDAFLVIDWPREVEKVQAQHPEYAHR